MDHSPFGVSGLHLAATDQSQSKASEIVRGAIPQVSQSQVNVAGRWDHSSQIMQMRLKDSYSVSFIDEVLDIKATT